MPYCGLRKRRAPHPNSQKLVRSSITKTASNGVSQPRWTTRRCFSARAKPVSTSTRLSPRTIANSENAKLNASTGAPPLVQPSENLNYSTDASIPVTGVHPEHVEQGIEQQLVEQ